MIIGIVLWLFMLYSK